MGDVEDGVYHVSAKQHRSQSHKNMLSVIKTTRSRVNGDVQKMLSKGMKRKVMKGEDRESQMSACQHGIYLACCKGTPSFLPHRSLQPL
jgi:hypothetical protein